MPLHLLYNFFVGIHRETPCGCAIVVFLKPQSHIALAFFKMLSKRSMSVSSLGKSVSSHVRNVTISLYWLSMSCRLPKIGS